MSVSQILEYKGGLQLQVRTGTITCRGAGTGTSSGTGVHLRVSGQSRCLKANVGRYSKYSAIQYKYTYRCNRCSPESVQANRVFEGKCGQVQQVQCNKVQIQIQV